MEGKISIYSNEEQINEIKEKLEISTDADYIYVVSQT